MGKKDRNKTKKFDPFQIQKCITYSGVTESDLNTALTTIKHPSAIKTIKKWKKEYEHHLKVFRYKYRPNVAREHILFYSLISDERLKFFTENEEKFNLVAGTFPVQQSSFDEKNQIHEIDLDLVTYYDPNSTEENKVSEFYKKNDSKKSLLLLGSKM